MSRSVYAFLFGAVMAVLAGNAAGAETKRVLGVFFRGCEEACQGFQKRIAESGMDVEFVIRDVAQDKTQIPKIVEEARAMSADLVLTWGTSVTLGVIGTLDDRDDPLFLNDIPVVFTVVADPFGTRIAVNFERSGRNNVAGTFNRVPEAVNIEVIRQYDPEFKKLGLLYNTNERNSMIKFEELSALAPTLGVELVALELAPAEAGVPAPAVIPERIKTLSEAGVRWIYLGSSSFLQQNGALFTSSAVENGIAVVSPYEDLVRNHRALLSVAARYEDVGRLAADQAIKIMQDGATPGDLPIAMATDFAYVINIDVAKELDRFPPFAFLQIAETVGQ